MGETSTLLLSTSPSPPANLPLDLNLPDPYMLTVPVSPALTPTSLTLKSSLWPTVYAPRRKDQAEGWSRGKVRWAWEAMKLAIEEAARARTDGEVGIIPILVLVAILMSHFSCQSSRMFPLLTRPRVIRLLRSLHATLEDLLLIHFGTPLSTLFDG